MGVNEVTLPPVPCKSCDTPKVWNALIKNTFYVMAYTIRNLVLTLSTHR